MVFYKNGKNLATESYTTAFLTVTFLLKVLNVDIGLWK